MGVIPHMKESRLPPGLHMAFRRTPRTVEIPPPDRKPECHARERRRSGGKAPILLAFDSTHHGGDELSEKNDREQTESFGIVGRIRRMAKAMFPRKPGCREISG